MFQVYRSASRLLLYKACGFSKTSWARVGLGIVSPARLARMSAEALGRPGPFQTLVSCVVPCSSQFAENISPRSNRLVHGALPSVNEPVRSVLPELTGANCAQTRVTITLIAE